MLQNDTIDVSASIWIHSQVCGVFSVSLFSVFVFKTQNIGRMW